MSADNRSVATDALETLGTVLSGDVARDAIHLAVEPVQAGESLLPGEHILLREGKAYSALPGKGLGIVDPFIQGHIAMGQRFWLVVYPRQITSLRHVWTHPAFEAVSVPALAVGSTKEEAEKWMRAWAMQHMSVDYYGEDDKLSEEQAYANAIEAGRRNHLGPYEGASDHIDSQWWDCWEAITGEKGDREEYFSCSC